MSWGSGEATGRAMRYLGEGQELLATGAPGPALCHMIEMRDIFRYHVSIMCICIKHTPKAISTHQLPAAKSTAISAGPKG